MSFPVTPMRLLLVEDDPISRSYLEDALGNVPALVDSTSDIASAVALARLHSHALWIVDAHLPDGDGADCLRALRSINDTTALAITASTARDELDALCDAGFVEVLCKPVSVALLCATVRRLAGGAPQGIREPSPGKLPVWDEQQALSAIGGDRAALLKLRGLFQTELPGLLADLQAARLAADTKTAQSVLHKLKASCGFVGAARLCQAVDALAQSPLDAQLAQLFDFAAQDALAWKDDQS